MTAEIIELRAWRRPPRRRRYELRLVFGMWCGVWPCWVWAWEEVRGG